MPCMHYHQIHVPSIQQELLNQTYGIKQQEQQQQQG